MDIKKVFKTGSLLIVFVISVIIILTVLSLEQIRENSFENKEVEKTVTIQRGMNSLVQDIPDADTENSLKNLHAKLTELEIAFDKIKDTTLKELINDTNDRDNLITLSGNEYKIENDFNSVYKMQEKILKLSETLEKYLKQEIIKIGVIQDVIKQTKNLKLMGDFIDLQYYQRNFLYLKKDKNSFDKWLQEIEDFKIYFPKKIIDQYIHIVTEIGKTQLQIDDLKISQQKSLITLNKIISFNDQLGLKIKENRIKFEEAFIQKVYITVLGILFVLTPIMIYVFIRVNKRIFLSVDEINKKVDEATKEIQDLNEDIEKTQREVVFTLGAIGETRSKETGNHVKRVAEYSYLLAKYYGLSEEKALMIQQASPMHDIGKVGIPDSILNKPGKFIPEEREIMNTHAKLGYDMLKHSKRPLLKLSATIAYEHHEKWDGTGYPKGLKGEKISIEGRITALADVFDALGSDRCYKKAWEDEKIFKLFLEEKGKHFDPKLVEIFFNHLEEFLYIRDKFKDDSIQIHN